MKISLNLISQLSGLDATEADIKLIGERIGEVESVEKLADKYEKIVVGQIKKALKHKDADKIGVYKVDIGGSTVQVCAGDKTLELGDKVAYIPPKAVVPSTFDSEEPMVIAKRDLRGEESNGMLGSEQELDFGPSHQGVLKLDTDVKPGTTLAEAYDLDDIIVEIENKTLTHRPDCFGLIGFAREFSAVKGRSFDSPEWYLDIHGSLKSDGDHKLAVINNITSLCPRYTAVKITDVNIQSSPTQLKSYLKRLGIRPVNNIVDITNYVMVMTGQPSHAFDADEIKGAITIRTALKGETLTLLDDSQIKLDINDIVICDDSGPIALGGVMGGASSEIGDATTNIVIEVANFDMYRVRETSMRHGIFSDAVTRFARGQSPAQCLPVLVELAGLITASGGKVGSNIADSGATTSADLPVTASADEINDLLGTDYPANEMVKILQDVEFDVKLKVDEIVASKPYWRKDINIWQDLAEEIGRIKGYNSIKSTLPKRDLKSVVLDEDIQLKRSVRTALTNFGANELLTYSALSEDTFEKIKWPKDEAYHIRNARSPELAYMRIGLTPSLLARVHPNHKQGHTSFALFEVNPIHIKGLLNDEQLPQEFSRLAIVVSEKNFKSPGFFEVKNYLVNLLELLNVENVTFEPTGINNDLKDLEHISDLLQSGRKAVVKSGKTVIGVVGEPNGALRKAYKLPISVGIAELNLAEMQKSISNDSSYRKLSEFPFTDRDVTYQTDLKLEHSKLENLIKSELNDIKGMNTEISVVDIFKFDDKNKRTTFRIRFEHKSKTLQAAEVNKIVEDLSSTLKGSFKAVQI